MTVVRPERPADRAAVRRLVGDAFGGEEVPALLDALRASDAWRAVSYVVEQHAEVVAHLCCTRGWLDAPDRLVEVLVLSPVAVRPDRQRQGTGSLLVTESLRQLTARPEPLVFLEGDPAFYSRLGFVAAGPLGFTAPSERIPPAAFQVAALPGHQPWMRGAVVYPDVFWRHDSVGLRPG